MHILKCMALAANVAIAVVSVSLSSAIAADLSPSQEIEAQRVFGSFLSPFCPGRLLNDCPSGSAGELRDKIRARIAEGQSADQVLNGLFDDYGDRFRAAPLASGFGAVAWLAPGAFLLLGGLVLGIWLRAKGKNQGVTEPSPSTSTLSADEAERLARELSRER